MGENIEGALAAEVVVEGDSNHRNVHRDQTAGVVGYQERAAFRISPAPGRRSGSRASPLAGAAASAVQRRRHPGAPARQRSPTRCVFFSSAISVPYCVVGSVGPVGRVLSVPRAD